MAFNFTKILTGLRIIPKATSTADSQGDLEVLSTDGKLRHHNGTTVSPVVTEAHAATLTNKTFDADGTGNSISNIENADIKSGAAIDASKIADGSVSSTEFQYLSGVTSDIQTQLNTGATAISDHISDATDAHDASAISNVPAGNLAATDVQGALNELQSDVDTRALGSDLTNHISDATDAHDASSISVVASGNLAATEVQAALDEHQGDIDTLTTGLSNHLSDATDAHDASAISNVASGNLVATDVQAALNELQSDIDTRALGSDLTTHISDTTTHGTTGDIVGTSDTQVITNKDIDGGTASDTRRITVPKDTKANLDALTRKEATLVFGSDTDKLYVDNGVALTPVGAGNGSLDIFYQNDFSVDTSSIFSTGDNATFLGGGTLAGTLANETSAPISGTRSIKYTQASGSLNDYIASPAISLDLKQRGQEIKFSLYYKYDGADSDVKFIIYDVTNTTVLTTSLDVLKAATNSTRFEMAVFVPTSCTSIRYGFQTAVENSGKILIFDDVEISVNPFVYKNITETQEIHLHTFAGNSSANTVIPYFSTTDKNIGANILTVGNDSTNGNSFTALKDCIVIAVAILSPNTAATLGWSINANTSELDDPVYNLPNTKTFGIVSSATGSYDNCVANVKLKAGDILRFHGDGNSYSTNSRGTIQVVAEADVDSVVTPMKTTQESFEANTQTGTGSTNTKIPYFTNVTKNTSGVLATISNGSTDGFSVTALKQCQVTMTYSFSSSSESAMGISKNSNQLTTAIDTPITAAHIKAISNVDSTQQACVTATVTLDAGDILRPHLGGSITMGDASQCNISITVNAVNSTFLAAIPIPRVAYLKDVKASGTNGGGFTSGSWITRDLNTVEGDSAIVSLSSNQFTLQAGIYDIEASAPGFLCGYTKIKIANITDTTEIMGEGNVRAGSTVQINDRVMGRVEITSAKVFELQHRCGTTRGTDGLGSPDGSLGGVEVYGQVKITKVK
jgi:hypothetical protein